MKKRCYTPSYNQFHRYGGRGIRVCDEWRNSFKTFFAFMGPRPSPKHSVDRIDNDGNYEPGNVRWETSVRQRQKTSRIRLTAECARWVRFWVDRGFRHADIGRSFGVDKGTISKIKRGLIWVDGEP